MDFRPLALFICIVTVITISIRCRDLFLKSFSITSMFCFFVMMLIAFDTFPNKVQGIAFHVMGIGTVLGLAFTLATIIRFWFLNSRRMDENESRNEN